MLGVFLTGCDRPEPFAYRIPKESRDVSVPGPVATTNTPAEAKAPAPTSGSGMQVLPGMQEAADEAGTILYTTPTDWTELPASGIRKAYLQVSGENGTADLTITAFPGDVGGVLANINRWRGQIGLEPATADQVASFTEQINIFQHGGLYVEIDGAPDSIRAAILPFHGYTWFIKLQGASSTVFENEIIFKEFLDTIEMEGHAH